MKKSYIYTFLISTIIVTTVVIVSFLVMLPQPKTFVNSNVIKYNSITKSDYVYEQTKDITKDNLVHEYNVSEEEMKKFKENHSYLNGNNDPFTPQNVKEEIQNNNKNNSQNEDYIQKEEEETNNKITNSNNGEAPQPSLKND